VTSPPYWGLRDYHIGGQIGLERTPEEYVATMVEVFREIWQVLRDDGTVWLNLGDSYAHGIPGGNCVFENGRTDGRIFYETDKARGREKRATMAPGFKPKDLIGMPWRVAFALQADGWYLRSDIIWHKSNPMPESVTDRPTKAHEYIFLLSKSADYYYDATAIAEPSSGTAHSRGGGVHPKSAEMGSGIKQNSSFSMAVRELVSVRNRRSVWTINTEPTPEAHFATFPQALVMPCILAGTSAKGACARCGTPWGRITEREKVVQTGITPKQAGYRAQGLASNKSTIGRTKAWDADEGKVTTLGWRPSCKHTDAGIKPCLVLDPFAGSATTLIVAERLGRIGIGLELSAEYIEIAKRRTSQRGLMFTSMRE
jgi:site-specific DNA-methyltransferase (adenine-specific)